MTNAKVHAKILGNTIKVDLPSIEIRDLADADGNAVPPDQIARAFLTSIAGQIETVIDLPKLSEGVKKARKEITKLEEKITEETGLDIDIKKDAAETGKKLIKGAKDFFGK